ncbi:MAG TPA: hypothetical protein VF619_07945 [Allosphingosinicella sp.]
MDCFLRPQVVIGDAIEPGRGGLLLFLASFFRWWGVDGYFAHENKPYFRFAEAAAPLAGLRFELERPKSPRLAMEAIHRVQKGGGPLLVPVNLIEIPHSPHYRKTDQAHYFIVERYLSDQKCLQVFDNLHLDPGPDGVRYGAARLPEPVLEKAIAAYWASHVEGPVAAAHKERAYWLLRMSAAGPRPRERFDLAAALLHQGERLLRGMKEGLTTCVPADERGMAALREALSLGPAEVEVRVRAYLSDVNSAIAYLSLLKGAVEERSPAAKEALADRCAALEAKANAVRGPLLVSCLAGEAPSDEIWSDASDRLREYRAELRDALLETVAAKRRRAPDRTLAHA